VWVVDAVNGLQMWRLVGKVTAQYLRSVEQQNWA